MHKTLFVITAVLIATAILAQPKTPTSRQKPGNIIKVTSYDETKYKPIIDTLNKTYKKYQYQYALRNEGSRYYYQIIPITLYPFFCADTYPDKKYDVIYIDGTDYSAFRHLDNVSIDHVLIAVESHTRGSKLPATKTYRLHHFTYDVFTDRWIEEGKAKEIILELTNSKEGAYGCKAIKK
jgi:hypothetical protein